MRFKAFYHTKQIPASSVNIIACIGYSYFLSDLLKKREPNRVGQLFHLQRDGWLR
ncbi:hypothetical protein F0726_02334 [Acidithiobacillus caldus]|nr:hypothetical protein F0726_02334 [Acidithiobacillus caldus]